MVNYAPVAQCPFCREEMVQLMSHDAWVCYPCEILISGLQLRALVGMFNDSHKQYLLHRDIVAPRARPATPPPAPTDAGSL